MHILGRERYLLKETFIREESSDRAPPFLSGIEISPLQTANKHIQDKTPVDI